MNQLTPSIKKKEVPTMPAQKFVAPAQTRPAARLIAALLLGFVTLGLATIGQPTASRAADLKSPLARLDLKDGDGIVFYGDSITHQRLYTQYIADYFYTRFPRMRLRLHNAGVSGSVAWEALERFDRDVAAYKPKYVLVLLGMNDGNHEPFNPSIFATYRQDMTTIFQKIQGIGAMPIIMTPTMFDARVRRAKRPHANPENTSMYNAVLAYYGAWLREVATEQGFGFVDVWSPLNNIVSERRKSDPKFTLVPDSVHPGPAGHMVMAMSIIHDLDLPQQVSDIRVTLSADKQHQSEAAGGRLRDLNFHNDRLEFNWQADCLPWVVPEEAQIGAQLTDLGYRVNQEALEIHGLAPGNYTLSIDGHEVGTYDNVQLEHHIELQENAATPQYQQALAVANLNKQRNEGPIDALRTEWWNFQDYVDAKRELKVHPDNAKAKDSLSKSEKLIAGMDVRIAADDAAGKLIEDKIFQINKPPLRKYVLVRRVAKTN
jgi:lysophospholipase L1-like esterase